MSPNIDHENVAWSATCAGGIEKLQFLVVHSKRTETLASNLDSEREVALEWDGRVENSSKLDFPGGVESRMHAPRIEPKVPFCFHPN